MYVETLTELKDSGSSIKISHTCERKLAVSFSKLAESAHLSQEEVHGLRFAVCVARHANEDGALRQEAYSLQKKHTREEDHHHITFAHGEVSRINWRSTLSITF